MIRHRIKVIAIPSLIVLFCIVVSNYGQDHTNSADEIMHHVNDQNSWKPIPFLPAIPFSDINIGPISIHITQHVVMLWIICIFLLTLLIKAFARPTLVPSRLSSTLEPIVFFVRDSLVFPALGRKRSEKWLPFFYTLFFFLLTTNLLGLIPLFPTVTSNLSVTLALAMIVFFATIIQGMYANGFVGFFSAMVPKGIPGPISLFLLLIEVLSLFIRNSVLAIRLFANMVAGHFIIVSLLLLVIIVSPYAGFVSVPMALFIDLLEVLVAIIQAVVFTTLSAIYIGMACSQH